MYTSRHSMHLLMRGKQHLRGGGVGGLGEGDHVSLTEPRHGMHLLLRGKQHREGGVGGLGEGYHTSVTEPRHVWIKLGEENRYHMDGYDSLLQNKPHNQAGGVVI
ncbi:hypothetical protein J6590_034004 [Homalodisca vitripennis]|nr:hypothetical protein J6590_034004 [Homalodisca vitripennis]